MFKAARWSSLPLPFRLWVLVLKLCATQVWVDCELNNPKAAFWYCWVNDTLRPPLSTDRRRTCLCRGEPAGCD